MHDDNQNFAAFLFRNYKKRGVGGGRKEFLTYFWGY